MRNSHYMLINCMLVLSMLILPLQNAWSMASMDSCELAMPLDSGVLAQDMSMQKCPHHMQTGDQAESMSDSSCDDSQCSDCSHFASMILPEFADYNFVSAFSSPSFKNSLLSFLPYPDLPPPLFPD